jgi:predicted nucleotidyltransferase
VFGIFYRWVRKDAPTDGKSMGMNMRTIKAQNLTTPLLLNRYVLLLEEIFGNNLKGFAVFGSFARGSTEFPGSDIDLL